MKVTPLRRRAPLKRGGWIARQRRRRPEPGAAAWRRGLGACVVCPAEGGVCAGRVQGHHVVARQTLRRLGLVAVLFDRRNRLSVCEHRHEQHTTGYKPIPQKVLPASVFEFALELDLIWYLDKHYPSRPVLRGIG